MNMLRTLRFGLLVLLSGVAISSCINPPDFPDTPSIEFKSLQVQRLPSAPGLQPVDSITVAIEFKDGDGDLGLNSEEYSRPPYNRLNSDNTVNLNHWNYFFKIFVKENGRFVQRTTLVNGSPLDPTQYYGQFPHLEPNADKKAPLKGQLYFGQTFGLGDLFLPGEEVQFEIYIKDRALNTSNTVTTNSFVVQR